MDPGPLRIRKIANVALAMASRLDGRDSSLISVGALEATYQRCREIREALESPESEKYYVGSEWFSDAVNYLGVATFHLGLLLRSVDSELGSRWQHEGAAMVVSSIDLPKQHADDECRTRLWKNIWEVLELYSRIDRERATQMVERARQYAEKKSDEVHHVAVQTVEVPWVRRYLEICVRSGSSAAVPSLAALMIFGRLLAVAMVVLFLAVGLSQTTIQTGETYSERGVGSGVRYDGLGSSTESYAVHGNLGFNSDLSIGVGDASSEGLGSVLGPVTLAVHGNLGARCPEDIKFARVATGGVHGNLRQCGAIPGDLGKRIFEDGDQASDGRLGQLRRRFVHTA